MYICNGTISLYFLFYKDAQMKYLKHRIVEHLLKHSIENSRVSIHDKESFMSMCIENIHLLSSLCNCVKTLVSACISTQHIIWSSTLINVKYMYIFLCCYKSNVYSITYKVCYSNVKITWRNFCKQTYKIKDKATVICTIGFNMQGKCNDGSEGMCMIMIW